MIPFRYDERATKTQFKELFKFQWGTQKKNQALNDALEIAAAAILKYDTTQKKENWGLYKEAVIKWLQDL